MNIYDINGTEISYDENSIFNFGNCSELYKYDNKNCLKLYYDSCDTNNRINPEIFNLLKNLELENMIELKQLVYKNKNLSTIKGYIMKYYKSEQYKILKESTNFSIENMKKIENLFQILSKNNIVVDDVKRENIIFDGTQMIVIDPDKFYICNNSYEYCIYKNNISLLQLFKNIYLKEAFHMLKSNSCNPYEQLDYLFDISESVEDVYIKLKKYEYPIQYFK